MIASELGLSRENSETIGFVLTSLLCSAIDLEELKQWCYQTIEDLEISEVPAYLYDLSDYSDTLSGIYRPLGFVPSWQRSDEDTNALYGIAMKREKEAYEWPIGREDALAALSKRPAIEERFRRTFPFIDF